MALIDVVKWEVNNRELVHKFPSEDLRIGSQLIVYKGQIAFFIKDGKICDEKFSPGSDIWTEEIPHLGFSDEKVQRDYQEFIFDIEALFSEETVDEVFINAKIGEESEYVNAKNPLVIRKIEEYSVDEIIK